MLSCFCELPPIWAVYLQESFRVFASYCPQGNIPARIVSWTALFYIVYARNSYSTMGVTLSCVTRFNRVINSPHDTARL